MPIPFEPISLDRQQAYHQRFLTCPQVASDYSFINLWGWSAEYGLTWAWDDTLVWIKQDHPEPALWAPIGSWGDIDWESALDPYIADRTQFIRIPEQLAEVWQSSIGHFKAEEARGQWDYLYSLEDLVALKGNRYHKKKNLVNQFRRKYDFAYLPLKPETISQAIGMQTDWCEWRDCESSEMLSAENKAIEKILHQWENLKGISGGALMVENKIVAYTVAETLAEDTLLIHFEKANPDYKGAYQAINQVYLENAGDTYRFVNREQDLDDDGLRKAKLSYHPVDFIKKYKVTTG